MASRVLMVARMVGASLNPGTRTDTYGQRAMAGGSAWADFRYDRMTSPWSNNDRRPNSTLVPAPNREGPAEPVEPIQEASRVLGRLGLFEVGQGLVAGLLQGPGRDRHVVLEGRGVRGPAAVLCSLQHRRLGPGIADGLPPRAERADRR